METAEANPKLEELLAQTAAMHKHLCPRQVLGVRMGLYAFRLLGIEVPQPHKRIIAFVESDGCFADGVSVATGCALGHRTMRLVDYGKVAATFVDTETGRALRLFPRADVRERAAAKAPATMNHWKAQLESYQVLSDEEMFQALEVGLNLDVHAIVGKAGMRVHCGECGEEILNQREVAQRGKVLCQSCAGESYWRLIVEP